MYDGHNNGNPETVERGSVDGFPLGIKLLAGANMLTAILAVFITFIVLPSGPDALMLVGMVAFWVAVPLLFIARGLLKLHFWAWFLTLLAQTAMLPVYVLLVVGGKGTAVVPLLIGLVVVGYLVSVRDLYRGNPSDDAS